MKATIYLAAAGLLLAGCGMMGSDRTRSSGQTASAPATTTTAAAPRKNAIEQAQGQKYESRTSNWQMN